MNHTGGRGEDIMKVRLLRDMHYPASWVMTFKPLPMGTIVPVIPATNLPNNHGKFWINTPELKDDAYGILLLPGDYELLKDRKEPICSICRRPGNHNHPCE